jgi:hypothetical protein
MLLGFDFKSALQDCLIAIEKDSSLLVVSILLNLELSLTRFFERIMYVLRIVILLWEDWIKQSSF